MKITKQRLKEIIREELTLGDLQSDEKFTGGSREEQLLILMKAREILAAMSKEELGEFARNLDAETAAELRHLLANPLYAPNVAMDAAWEKEVGPQGDEMELQEGRSDQELLNALIQAYGRRASHVTVKDIQKLHPSYKGSLRDIAQGLGLR